MSHDENLTLHVCNVRFAHVNSELVLDKGRKALTTYGLEVVHMCLYICERTHTRRQHPNNTRERIVMFKFIWRQDAISEACLND